MDHQKRPHFHKHFKKEKRVAKCRKVICLKSFEKMVNYVKELSEDYLLAIKTFPHEWTRTESTMLIKER